MFIAPCMIRKNIASRKWRCHFREAKDFQAVTRYKHFVPFIEEIGDESS